MLQQPRRHRVRAHRDDLEEEAARRRRLEHLVGRERLVVLVGWQQVLGELGLPLEQIEAEEVALALLLVALDVHLDVLERLGVPLDGGAERRHAPPRQQLHGHRVLDRLDLVAHRRVGQRMQRVVELGRLVEVGGDEVGGHQLDVAPLARHQLLERAAARRLRREVGALHRRDGAPPVGARRAVAAPRPHARVVRPLERVRGAQLEQRLLVAFGDEARELLVGHVDAKRRQRQLHVQPRHGRHRRCRGARLHRLLELGELAFPRGERRPRDLLHRRRERNRPHQPRAAAPRLAPLDQVAHLRRHRLLRLEEAARRLLLGRSPATARAVRLRLRTLTGRGRGGRLAVLDHIPGGVLAAARPSDAAVRARRQLCLHDLELHALLAGVVLLARLERMQHEAGREPLCRRGHLVEVLVAEVHVGHLDADGRREQLRLQTREEVRLLHRGVLLGHLGQLRRLRLLLEERLDGPHDVLLPGAAHLVERPVLLVQRLHDDVQSVERHLDALVPRKPRDLDVRRLDVDLPHLDSDAARQQLVDLLRLDERVLEGDVAVLDDDVGVALARLQEGCQLVSQQIVDHRVERPHGQLLGLLLGLLARIQGLVEQTTTRVL